MIAIIRISGMVEMTPDIKEALYRLRLRRKFVLVLAKDNDETRKMLQHVRNFIAYGPVDKETLKELIAKRAESSNKKKIDADAIVADIEKKKLEELGIKPFFRLHPPRGGINSKSHFPIRKGVLGDNKEKINELIRRML